MVILEGQPAFGAGRRIGLARCGGQPIFRVPGVTKPAVVGQVPVRIVEEGFRRGRQEDLAEVGGSAFRGAFPKYTPSFFNLFWWPIGK